MTPAFHNTDTGNAERLVHRYGNDIRYVYEWGRWHIWDGRRWAEDRSRRIEMMAKAVALSIYNDAPLLVDKKQRKELTKWAADSEAHQRIIAMVRRAQSEPDITVSHELFDQNALLLNVRNGVIDLETGLPLPHERCYYMTKYIDIDYDPAATCDLWIAFLDRILDGDQETIRFVQRAVGCTLSGSNREKMWLFLYGKKGDNGKSTFLEILMTLFGAYATKLPMQTLLQSQGDTSRYRNDIATLVGMRLVIASEIESNRRLNESLVKDLTGNDTLIGNELYQRSFKFQPSCVLWMYGNYQPIIRGTDDAIWGRVKLIPFEVQIPKAQQDTLLRQKLLAELPGILTWAVQGCLDWQAHGLQPSANVTSHTAQYRGTMDTTGRFLQECCVEGKQHYIAFGLLFGEYQTWCSDNDEDAFSSAKFAKTLTERGFPSIRGAAGIAMRKGITLQSVAAASP